MKPALLALVTAVGLALATAGQAEVKPTYFPEYAGPDGGIVQFNRFGFYILYFTDEGDYSYDCRKLESLTSSMHWAKCEGGEKFLYTLDPKHPETMKIGDAVYKACGKLRDQC